MASEAPGSWLCIDLIQEGAGVYLLWDEAEASEKEEVDRSQGEPTAQWQKYQFHCDW